LRQWKSRRKSGGAQGRRLELPSPTVIVGAILGGLALVCWRFQLTRCDTALACVTSEGRRADIYSLATAQFGNHDFVRETFFVLPSLI
jgi:hypothetical protein